MQMCDSCSKIPKHFRMAMVEQIQDPSGLGVRGTTGDTHQAPHPGGEDLDPFPTGPPHSPLGCSEIAPKPFSSTLVSYPLCPTLISEDLITCR